MQLPNLKYRLGQEQELRRPLLPLRVEQKSLWRKLTRLSLQKKLKQLLRLESRARLQKMIRLRNPRLPIRPLRLRTRSQLKALRTPEMFLPEGHA